ncbi:MAG: hypothetical protein IMW99_02000 [Firmicutes bacterium]|nr:hypothetical protein [Bacillota bacterium]
MPDHKPAYNQTLVGERTALIRTSLARLRQLRKLTREEFLADPDQYAIGEHHLRRALEA